MTVRRGLHLGSDCCPMLKASRELKEPFSTREDFNEEESFQKMQFAQKTPRPLRPIASIGELVEVVEMYMRTSSEQGGEASAMMHNRSGLQIKDKDLRKEDAGEEEEYERAMPDIFRQRGLTELAVCTSKHRFCLVWMRSKESWAMREWRRGGDGDQLESAAPTASEKTLINQRNCFMTLSL